MKFKLKIKDKHSDYTRIEEFDSEDLYLNVGYRKIERVDFPIKADTKEEFMRFGKALIDNYNKHAPEKNHREVVEVIIDD